MARSLQINLQSKKEDPDLEARTSPLWLPCSKGSLGVTVAPCSECWLALDRGTLLEVYTSCTSGGLPVSFLGVVGMQWLEPVVGATWEGEAGGLLKQGLGNR